MKTTSAKTKHQALTPLKTLEIGYRALVEKLGPVGAAQFMMHAFPGEGDSVKYYRQMRGDKNVSEVAKEIRRAKKVGLI